MKRKPPVPDFHAAKRAARVSGLASGSAEPEAEESSDGVVALAALRALANGRTTYPTSWNYDMHLPFRLVVLSMLREPRIANLRKVDFTTGGQNFVLVLSPGLISQAPHAFLATVRVADAQENPLYMTVTTRFPNISTIRVKDAIQQVQALLASLAKQAAGGHIARLIYQPRLPMLAAVREAA